MEERLESTLWAATVIMKQMNGVYQQLLTEQQRRPADATAKDIKRRLRELEAQRVAIRDIIAGTHVIEST